MIVQFPRGILVSLLQSLIALTMYVAAKCVKHGGIIPDRQFKDWWNDTMNVLSAIVGAGPTPAPKYPRWPE